MLILLLTVYALSTHATPLSGCSTVANGCTSCTAISGGQFRRVLFFSATTASHGDELYTLASGSSAIELHDIAPGAASSFPANVSNHYHRAFFSANDGIHGFELHRTDGVATHTQLVDDINPGSSGSFPGAFVSYGINNETLAFAATRADIGRELFHMPYTVDMPTMMYDIYPGITSSYPDSPTRVWHSTQGDSPSTDDTTFVFAATSPMYGRELFITGQTPSSVEMYADIYPGPPSSDPEQLTFLRQGLVFVAKSDPAAGREFHAVAAPMPLSVPVGNLATIAPMLRDTNIGPADLDVFNTSSTLTPLINARCCVGHQLSFSGTFFGNSSGTQFGFLSSTTPGSGSVGILQQLGDPPAPGGAHVSPVVYMNRRRYAIATIPVPGGNTSNSEYRRALMIDSLRPGDTGEFTVQVCETNFVCTPTTTQTPSGPITTVSCINQPICHQEVRVYTNLAIKQLNPVETFFPNATEIGSITHVEQLAVVEGVGLFVDATSSMYGRELWFMHWDESAFTLVDEIVPGPTAGFENIASMAAMDAYVYFLASVQDSPPPPFGTGSPGSGGGYGLYKSNGAAIELVSMFDNSFASPGVLRLKTLEDLAPVDDDCGRCGGTNQDKDPCGVCFGSGGLCFPDCFGTPFGTAARDACGICHASPLSPGYNSTCRDCLGVVNGAAIRDACDVCFAAPPPETGISFTDANATAIKTYYPCFNTSCADCRGVPNGNMRMDVCGICGGDDTTCVGCNLIFYPWLAHNRTVTYESNSTVATTNITVINIPLITWQVLPRRDEYVCQNITATCGDLFYESKTFLVNVGCRYLNTTLRPADLHVTFLKCNTTILPASLAASEVSWNEAYTTHQCPVDVQKFDPQSLYDTIACSDVTTSRFIAPTPEKNISTVALVHVPCRTDNVSGVCCDDQANVHLELSPVIPWAWRPMLEVHGIAQLQSFGDSWINCSALDAATWQLYNSSSSLHPPLQSSIFANHTNTTTWDWLRNRCHQWWCSVQTVQKKCTFGSNKATIEFTSAKAYPTTSNGTLYCDQTTFQCRVTSHTPRYTTALATMEMQTKIFSTNEIPRLDSCNVCGGNGTNCTDCAQQFYGEYIRDECGTCMHPQSPLRGNKCRDCLGVINGTAQIDICGLCLLPTNNLFNRTCPGCDGIMASGKVFDACYVCDGDGSTCTDCLGVIGGDADVDLCDVCRNQLDPQRDSSCLGCDNVRFSGKKNDSCGVCGGDNSTCTDCFGVYNGTAVKDSCGLCFANATHPLFNTSCPGCDGIIASNLKNDACGVCGGDNSTCYIDCLGVGNGTAIVDACGVCTGTNSTCPFDCTGTAYGLVKLDACGVCGGDNSTCPIDCAGHVLGTTIIDACGVCGGTNTTCSDCSGTVFGMAKIDACGVCGGINTTCTFDCFGTAYGTAKIDACGVCSGDNSTCPIDCAGTPSGSLKYDHCGVCGGLNNTCLSNWCYVIPTAPVALSAPLPVSTSPWLVFRTLHKALEICNGHIGIRIAVPGSAPAIPVDTQTGPIDVAVLSPTGTFTIERWPTPANPAVLDTFNVALLTGGPHVLRSTKHIAIKDIRIRSTFAFVPVLSIYTGGCTSAARVVVDVAQGSILASPGTTPAALALVSTPVTPGATSIPVCSFELGPSRFETAVGITATATPVRSVNIASIICTSVSGMCLSIDATGGTMINGLVASLCGYGATTPCVFVNTLGPFSLSSAVFQSSFVGAPVQTPALVVSGSTSIALVSVSIVQTTNPVVITMAPVILSDTDVESNTAKLRSLWLTNRNINAPLVARSSSGLIAVGQCQYGCGELVIPSYASDAAFSVQTTVFHDSDWIHARLAVPGDPTRVHYKPVILYIIGCDGPAAPTAAVPPSPTYACASGVRRILVYDHQTSPLGTLLNYPRIQSVRLDPDTFHVKFRANILLSSATAPQNTKTLVFVYTIIDLVHLSNVYSLATAPLSSSVLNPTMTHVDASGIVVRCAVGLVPACPGSTLEYCANNIDTLCINATTLSVGSGSSSGGSSTTDNDNESGLSSGAIAGIVIGGVLVVAGIGIGIGMGVKRGGGGSGGRYAKVGGGVDSGNERYPVTEEEDRVTPSRNNKLPHILL